MKFPSVISLLATAALLSFGIPGLGANDQTPGKNIIVFLVDDLGWKDLGCYGSSFYESPRIDALASESALFTNAYTPNPVCSPTRAAIMTGRYPSRVNITDWIPGMTPRNPRLVTPEDRYNLALQEVTVAEALRERGYQTFYAGKWHLGDEGHFPEDQGFDINKGGHHKGSPPGGYYAPFKNPKLDDKPDDHYLTDRLTDEGILFLESRDQGKPFLMFMAYYTVHTPIQGWDVYDDYFTEKQKSLPHGGEPQTRKERDGLTRLNQSDPKYAAMVRALDNSVGRILDALKAMDLEDQTIVIFTSDNGGLTTRAGIAPTSELPLRAGKGWCYEGGIRIPTIIRAPGIGATATKIDTPIISMDFFPTILDLAGLPPRPELHLDGLSLKPLLQGKPIQDRPLFWHYPHYHGSTWKPGAAIRSGNWKLVKSYEWETVELYNLKDDIGETKDLSQQYPEKTQELLDLLEDLQRKTKAKIPYPK